MYKFLFCSILFLFSSFSFAAEIKAISGIKYFPPTPYSNVAMNSYRGGVTVGGQFAIAKIKPSSIIGLGKQLAKGNPYTLAAMAALAYYQDDLGNWFLPPELTGVQDKAPPEVEYNQLIADTSQDYYDAMYIGEPSVSDPDEVCDASFPKIPESQRTINQYYYENITGRVELDGHIDEYTSGYTVICAFEKHGMFSPDYEYRKRTEGEGDLFSFTTGAVAQKTCPPKNFPLYTHPEYDDLGEIEACVDPADEGKYKPTPVTQAEMSKPYADDLMKWHNESIESLQNWEPYIDTSTGNVEPEYIESYNKPLVSPTMNDYMVSVASDNYQTNDSNAANYVPSDMVQPTQTAINSTYNDVPFVDPTTGDVTTPQTSIDGVATPDPVPTLGGADNPMHVTGNITVDIQMPEDDTLSQTEYEQSERMFQSEQSELANSSLDSINTATGDVLQQESDFIDGLGAYIEGFDVPQLPTLASFFPSFNSGCVGFNLDVSVAGTTKNISFDKHCSPWNAYVNPVLTWFLYMMTSLYVLNLAGRTLTGLKT